MVIISEWDEVFACNECKKKDICKMSDDIYNTIVNFGNRHIGDNLCIQITCDNYEDKRRRRN